MHKDTRDRNKYFSGESPGDYFKDYCHGLAQALFSVRHSELANAVDQVKNAPRIFVGGNGGSAAISDHLTCDFTKGIHSDKRQPAQVISLVGSHALHTAIANDLGYEQTLSYQLGLHGLGMSDTVILISSSGNSPNIVEAAKICAVRNACVIGMTGFDGGKLKEIASIKLHVQAENYGIVEDCHQIIMHVLAQYIYLHG